MVRRGVGMKEVCRGDAVCQRSLHCCYYESITVVDLAFGCGCNAMANSSQGLRDAPQNQ